MTVVVLLLTIVLGSQSKPDYGGTWVLNPVDSLTALRQSLTARDGQLTLTVTEKVVTIVHRFVAPEVAPGVGPAQPATGGWTEQTTVCAFGVSPAENARPMRPTLCGAKWDGDKLVISTRPKPYPNIAETTPPTVTTYTVAGTKMKALVEGPHPDGKQTLTFSLVYDKASGQAKADIEAALVAAKKDRKRILLNFGADWCAECRVLDKVFSDPDVSEFLKAHFVVVKVNTGSLVGLNYTEENIDMTLKYGAFTTAESIAIPFIVVLDEDGRVLDRTNKGEWKHAPAITQGNVLEALKRWAAMRRFGGGAKAPDQDE
jgi:thiol-disulfide isomerase/thioredoxin